MSVDAEEQVLLWKDESEMLVLKQVDWSWSDHLPGLSKMDLRSQGLDLAACIYHMK